ncbi:hypothetical protein B0T17DRAFT_529821 [Bombardia bombarda]|uniref:Uncharacterized protein n=1 Tax=Bombardia bombarda TaxID=252184 RepID=A0AA39XBQ7_9PEZI|nr:hypothetical protein B0T17DRAFT_529821 [Bombardia bombarda]
MVSSAVLKLAILGLVRHALALPAAEAAAPEKRDNIDIYACTGENWTGSCYHLYDPVSTCYNLVGNGQGLAYKLNSFGPPAGASCQLFYDGACKDAIPIQNSGHSTIVNPGVGNLNSHANSIGSFYCNWSNW